MPYTLQRKEKLLHKQLMKVTEPYKLWGLDLSEEGVRILHTMGIDYVIQGDVEKIPKELQEERFDIILAGEIIEHVANPGLFLSNLIPVMDKTTELVLTTPNAFSFKGFLHSMLHQEKVHQDHNYYFSYYVLKQLLEKFGLKCKEIYYYQEIEGNGLSKFFDKVISFVTLVSPVWADG